VIFYGMAKPVHAPQIIRRASPKMGLALL